MYTGRSRRSAATVSFRLIKAGAWSETDVAPIRSMWSSLNIFLLIFYVRQRKWRMRCAHEACKWLRRDVCTTRRAYDIVFRQRQPQSCNNTDRLLIDILTLRYSSYHYCAIDKPEINKCIFLFKLIVNIFNRIHSVCESCFKILWKYVIIRL